MNPEHGPARMGLELLCVVEEVGSEVRKVAEGDLAITSFHYQDYTGETCVEDFSACPNGDVLSECQSEATRVRLADGTLSVLPVGEGQSEILPSLLTLVDVYGTGHHAAVLAVLAGVRRGAPGCAGSTGYRLMDEREALKVLVTPRGPSVDLRVR